MSYTYEKTENEYELLKEGDYECVIEGIEKRTTPNGKNKLSLKYRVRSDVEQEGKNRVIFEDIWTETQNPQFYNRKRINQLLGTQEIVDGTTFENIDDVISFLLGDYLVCVISKGYDEYSQKDVNRVKFYKSSKTKSPTITKPTTKVADDLEQEELPF